MLGNADAMLCKSTVSSGVTPPASHVSSEGAASPKYVLALLPHRQVWQFVKKPATRNTLPRPAAEPNSLRFFLWSMKGKRAYIFPMHHSTDVLHLFIRLFCAFCSGLSIPRKRREMDSLGANMLSPYARRSEAIVGFISSGDPPRNSSPRR